MWDRQQQKYWISQKYMLVIDTLTDDVVCNYHAAFLYEKELTKDICFAENLNELEKILTRFSEMYDWDTYHHHASLGMWAVGKEYTREDYQYEQIN